MRNVCSVTLLGVAIQAVTAWQIPDAPSVSIGANEEFASIISGSFFSDGAFVVGDVMNARLSVFDAQGKLERMIGRKGSGPGEFSNLAWARSYRGDSIATYDRAQRRLTVFSRSGTPVRSVTITSPGNGLGPEAMSLLDDGRIVVQATKSIGAEAAPPGIHDATMELWVYSSTGRPLNRIASDLVNIQWVKLASPRLLMPRPFATVSLVASGGATVFVSDSADGPIRELNGTGAEVRRIGTRTTARTPSAGHISAYRERELARVRKANNANTLVMQTRILDATPYPDHVPALRRLLVDRDGRLWVEEYPAVGSTRQRFRVYTKDGRHLGIAAGPDGGRILDAQGMRALVSWSDADGVPYVRVYPIQAR